MDAEFPVLVILAGGRSERMGYPKGLKTINGTPLLTAHIEAFRAIGGTDAIVVSSVHFCAYDDLLNSVGVRHLRNPHPEQGPFSSLQIALAHIQERNVLMAPVDTHPITQEIYLTLSQALEFEILAAVPMYEERGGHPVLIHKKLCRELIKMDPSQSRLDHILLSLKAHVARLPVSDQHILQNYNTP